MDVRPRIVVVGTDEAARKDVVSVLERSGFSDVASHPDVTACTAACAPAALPELLIILGATDACAEARAVPALEDVPILAMPAPEATLAALAAGADDVAVGPPGGLPGGSIDAPVLAARVRRLLSAVHHRRRAFLLESLHEAMLRIHSLSTSDGDSPESLREVLLAAREVMQCDRASLVAHVESSDMAYVIASTDDPSLSQFALSLASYPEVAETLRLRKPVLIDDVEADPLTRPVAATLSDKGIRSMALFPVIWNGAPLGAVVYRHGQPGIGQLDQHRLGFALMVARHAAARMHHGKVIESLRDQTQRLSRTRYEAERRLRTIDSLKEHFEAMTDGVMVLDRDCRFLFVNRAAERITGYARDGLMDGHIGVLVVDAGQRDLATQVVEKVLHGKNVEAFDLDLRTTSGEILCVSVTTSTVLSQSHAAILTFRDVTAQRALESELRQTKEFLERLIDSAVDAIVSADLRGNIIIFNQGAERIFGYTAEEVIGRIPVWKLYADGVPRQVMRMLRSTQYGGVGRIEQTRREIINKQGERVPVNMTASIIYENGREIATVGIFSDLRDRIRIEQRLLQAQKKLELTREQAVLAELAGAAAHELNQPLQSIMGYGELIKRQLEPDATYRRVIDIILREAERMATIVRKIGEITKYETKEYIGKTRVLDLDKSSPNRIERGGVILPANEAAYDGTIEEEFEDEHQITIAQVELDEVLLPPDLEDAGADAAGAVVEAAPVDHDTAAVPGPADDLELGPKQGGRAP